MCVGAGGSVPTVGSTDGRTRVVGWLFVGTNIGTVHIDGLYTLVTLWYQVRQDGLKVVSVLF